MKQKKSVTLRKDIIEQIKQLADEEKVSFSEYVNEVLREHIAKNDSDNKTS